MDRRKFLSAAVCSAAAVVLQSPAFSWASQPPRVLSFYHTHTGEKLDIEYGGIGYYDDRALEEINQYLRDFRTGEVYPIDPNLLDQLASINHTLGSGETFEVISGYRSPKTNQQLRGNSSGVAKRSLHMKGKAIDIRLTGVQTKSLRQCALQMQCGGVGYYPDSDFVHIDTGRVRSW